MQLKFFKSLLKSSHGSIYLKHDIFQIAPKVTTFLGNYWAKIAQSGHTVLDALLSFKLMKLNITSLFTSFNYFFLFLVRQEKEGPQTSLSYLMEVRCFPIVPALMDADTSAMCQYSCTQK